MRKIVQIDEEKCNGCGLCVPKCHEGAIKILDGKAKLVSDKLCDGLGDCLGECPEGAITIIEREAENFDEQAVQEHLAALDVAEHSEADASVSSSAAPSQNGCPGSRMRSLSPAQESVHEPPAGGCPGARMRLMDSSSGTSPGHHEPGTSQLAHWPIKLELLHPEAPFLRGADLILTADCAPASVPSFNERFLQGKAIALGCPKFGDRDLFTMRLAEILAVSGLERLTVIHMEVPCCSGLIAIARKAFELSKAKVPLETIKIGLDGTVEARESLAS